MAGRLEDLRPQVRHVEQRWSTLLRLVPGWEEAAVVPDLASNQEVLAWCDLSDRAVVSRANDKRYSHQLERDLGVALPGATTIGSVAELECAAKGFDRWVAKHPFGVAGRERVLGRGAPTNAQINWCQRQFGDGWSLLFEPWLDAQYEYSLHFEIGEAVTYLGACGLLTAGDGTFRGIDVGGYEPDRRQIAIARQAVESLATLGYRGPVGVDAMVGSLGGDQIERPIMEINARFTFGRLGIELHRRANVERLIWRHDNVPQSLKPFSEIASGDACRLPSFADPEAASSSWCIAQLAPGCDQ